MSPASCERAQLVPLRPLRHERPQVFPREVGVAHRGPQVAVPHGLLHVHGVLARGEPARDAPVPQVVQVPSRGELRALRGGEHAVAEALSLLVIGLGGLWAAWTFWYTTLYLPAQLPAHLLVFPTLERAGTKGSLAAVRATVRIRNASPVRVHVLTSWFVMAGTSTLPVRMDDSTFAYSVTGLDPHDIRPRMRYARTRHQQVLATGRLLEPDWYFEPHDETTRDVVAYFPRGRFDRVFFGVGVAAAKNRESFVAKLYVLPNGELVDGIYLKHPGSKKEEPFRPDSIPEHERSGKQYGFAATGGQYRMSLWDDPPH